MIRLGLILCLSVVFLAGAAGVEAEEPPKRLKVKSVDFESNSAFTDRRLKRLMLTRPSRFYSRSYYNPDVLEDDLKILVLFYQQNGYLEASVEGTHIEADSTRNEAVIRINIFEGELTVIEGVGVFGATFFSDSLLLERAGIKKGDPFKRRRIQDGVLSILSLYANRGFLDAEIKPDVRINNETHRALVDFIIEERSPRRIGSIRVSGLEKTRQGVVNRELLFHEGDIAQYSLLLESQRNLYLTGLFQSAFVHPVPTADLDSTKKDILVDLKENESVELNFYVGYGSVEHGRARAELFNNNVAGSARKIGLATYASFISYGAEASFSEPRTFGLHWRTDLNLLYGYREEPGYDIERIGGRLVFGRTFTNRSNASLTYRYEKSDLSDVSVALGNNKLESDIRSLKLSLIFDTRDNLFNARRGVYLEWSNELVGSFLRGTEDFWKLTWHLKYFRPVGLSTVVATALEVGWEDYFGHSSAVPLNERFYLGGPNVMRGFEYRKVGPKDRNGEPLGGNFKIALNLFEIRRAIYKMLGGVVFADIGNLWTDIGDFRLSEMRSCAGIGVRANTPIGIVRCDYGINTDPRNGESAGTVYFSVGQAF